MLKFKSIFELTFYILGCFIDGEDPPSRLSLNSSRSDCILLKGFYGGDIALLPFIGDTSGTPFIAL